MSQFLSLIEEFDPNNSGSSKWQLKDFLESKGITVSIVRGTNMLYISTDSETVAVEVVEKDAGEEDAESVLKKDDPYAVSDAVEGLARTANSGAKGLAAKAMGTSAQQAKTAVKKRGDLSKLAVKDYVIRNKEIENSLRNVR